jgi:membrane protein
MSTTKSKDMGELTASLVGIGAVITISGAGALWTWSGYGDLPAQVAAGWGIDGRVTRFIAPGMLWGIALGLSFGLPLLLAVLGLFLRIGRVLSPIAGGVATLLTVSLNGMLMNQRGLTEEQVLASSVPSPVPLLFVGMLTAILVGVGMAFALRRRPDGLEVPVALDDADPRLAVDEDIRVAWTGRTRVGRGVLAALGASAVVTLILMICWLLVHPSWEPLVFMALLLLTFAFVGATTSASVTIDSRGVRIRGVGPISFADIPLTGIAKASVVDINPFRDFGGLGQRYALDGTRGFITGKGAALRVDRGESEGAFIITLHAPEAAATALNTLVARRSSRI